MIFNFTGRREGMFSTIWVCFLLLLLSPELISGGEIVRRLPGFDGELPFKLETGYINVDEIEFFYYFVESEGNPQVDPLFLWLTGGPGCTAFSGLIYEVGPMEYDISNYTGGLPKLRYYPYGRTQVSSMLFLDQPVGTGFSYSRTAGGWHTSDSLSVEQSYQFLIKWLKQHPQYQSLPFFVGGDSYAGLIVPLITKRIVQENRDERKLNINLKGYLVGSPLTDFIIDKNSKVIYAHKMGFISDEIYENARRSCNENYAIVDPANEACSLALRDVEKCTEDVSDRDILKPKCDYRMPMKSADEFSSGTEQFGLSILTNAEPPPYCIEFSLTHNNIWANDDGVQEALHVRKGILGRWERCNNSLSYINDVRSVVHVHKELSLFGLRALVESGDHDFSIPYVGTLQWIKSLNLKITDKWRPWYLDNQVAGFTSTYSSDHEYHITFASIKGAGHPAPEYYRRECFYLFQRWLHHQHI
ncbi:serine carboxypeptidase-like 18 [Impatiens glandulifera]|uniref:serine carboxypeptidase-like 18 n=1 Tax=Impatiens glandulifera TaxID=253017 RepID=UPI001FB161A2|nr:serine carboxypeptidase-like 18 [Impatiens glandulifera]